MSKNKDIGLKISLIGGKAVIKDIEEIMMSFACFIDTSNSVRQYRYGDAMKTIPLQDGRKIIFSLTNARLSKSPSDVFKDSSIVILVYNVKNSASFFKLDQKYIAEVKKNAPKNVVLGVIGMKKRNIKTGIDDVTPNLFAQDHRALFLLFDGENDKVLNDFFLKLAEKALEITELSNQIETNDPEEPEGVDSD